MDTSPSRHSHGHVSHGHVHDHVHPHELAPPPRAAGGFSLIALSATTRLLLVLPPIAALWLLTAWALRHG